MSTQQADNFKQYSVQIRAERLNNKIYRIFFIGIARNALRFLRFKFEYKCLNTPWQTVGSFDCRACRIWKETEEIFSYIRVPSELNDYDMEIKLSLMFNVDVNGYLSHKWMKYSNAISIKVLSSLITSQFHVNSYVKFRPPNSVKFHYGTIIEILSDNSTNTDNELLNICKIKDDEGNIWDNIPIKVLLQLLADDHIDFCIMNRNYADFEILFRSNNINKDNATQFNLYCTLVECGTMYSQKYGSLDTQTSINAEGRCFAYNVMNMLVKGSNKIDYNLKISCMKDCSSYLHTKQLQTIIKHKISKNESQDWSYGCDICRCRINEFDFMFHCDNTDQLQHDLCVLCVYEMMKKYRYFKHLLFPILLNNKSLYLDEHCIDILVSFVIGKLNKFHTYPTHSQPTHHKRHTKKRKLNQQTPVAPQTPAYL